MSGTYPGSYIPVGAASTAKFSHFIDDLLTPRLMAFRQIFIHDEPAMLQPDRLFWKVTFGKWLQDAPLLVRKNGILMVPSGVTNIDYVDGKLQANPVDLGADTRPRDTVEISYVFDYFGTAVQEGFLTAAVSIVNMTAVGPPTSYTIADAPTNWEGVITDLAYAMAIERLLLDYDLWRYRLVFAIGPNELEGGSGADISGQLTTLKQNAEERANTAMQNEKFKTGNYLSPPTRYYYAAIRGLGGGIAGAHGIPFVGGKLNGWKPCKIL